MCGDLPRGGGVAAVVLLRGLMHYGMNLVCILQGKLVLVFSLLVSCSPLPLELCSSCKAYRGIRGTEVRG